MPQVSPTRTRLTTARLNAILRLMRSEGPSAAELNSALSDMVNEYYALYEELHGVRSRLNRVLDICDREERNAMRWEDPISVPERVASIQRTALGDDVRDGGAA
ncbi:hypothetical protein ACIQNU_03930 [Streptomyces sp. NPDC091292]|uniref:hypothetical protein n=1 Tax=Streptomyces sp. NPDC091292 TaxID=3365991 RepID=UPI0038308BF8